VFFAGPATYRFYSLGAPDQGEHAQFKITQFDPNAQIADAEFTLEGLGATEGMRIVDMIEGTHFRYRLPVPEESERTESPEQARFEGEGEG
jgi:hypothetical protein